MTSGARAPRADVTLTSCSGVVARLENLPVGMDIVKIGMRACSSPVGDQARVGVDVSPGARAGEEVGDLSLHLQEKPVNVRFGSAAAAAAKVVTLLAKKTTLWSSRGRLDLDCSLSSFNIEGSPPQRMINEAAAGGHVSSLEGGRLAAA